MEMEIIRKAIRRTNFLCWVGGKSVDITADIVDFIITFITKIDGESLGHLLYFLF